MKKYFWRITIFIILDSLLFITVWRSLFEIFNYAKLSAVDEKDKIILGITVTLIFLVCYVGLDSISRFLVKKLKIKEIESIDKG